MLILRQQQTTNWIYGSNCASVPMNRLFLSGSCAPISPPLFRRVVGGQPSLDPAGWRWFLSMKLPGEPSWCGASLITDEWAVTAAHCMYDQNNQILD